MKNIFYFMLILSVVGCSNNENEVFEESVDSQISIENDHQEYKSNFNPSDYEEFPHYDLEEMKVFLHKLGIAGLLRDEDEVDEDYKSNLSRVFSEEEYDTRVSEAGENPFRRQEIIDNLYREAFEYGNSVKNRRKYVFDIDYETYYILDEGTKPVTAVMSDYLSYEPPIQSYDMKSQSFDLHSGTSIYLEGTPDLLARFDSLSYGSVIDETPPLINSIRKLHVADRQKAEEIQNLIDKNELGMKGKVYIEFVDNDSLYNMSTDVMYKIRGIKLTFYNKNTNKILEDTEIYAS